MNYSSELAASETTVNRFATFEALPPLCRDWLHAEGGFVPSVGGNLLAALLYFMMGLAVGIYFSAYGLFPAPIWLPSSIAIVAAMLGGRRFFPGIFLGSFLINYAFFGTSLHVAVLISLGNAGGPIFAANLLRRWRPEPALFASFAGVVAFIICAVLIHPAITALVGTLALNLEGPWNSAELLKTWTSWWLCDSGGTLAFARLPSFCGSATNGRRRKRRAN